MSSACSAWGKLPARVQPLRQEQHAAIGVLSVCYEPVGATCCCFKRCSMLLSTLLPAVSTAAKFFVGSHPDTTSISFIAGTIFTGKAFAWGCSW